MSRVVRPCKSQVVPGRLQKQFSRAVRPPLKHRVIVQGRRPGVAVQAAGTRRTPPCPLSYRAILITDM